MATRDVLLRYRRTSQPAPGGGTLRLPTGRAARKQEWTDCQRRRLERARKVIMLLEKLCLHARNWLRAPLLWMPGQLLTNQWRFLGLWSFRKHSPKHLLFGSWARALFAARHGGKTCSDGQVWESTVPCQLIFVEPVLSVHSC